MNIQDLQQEINSLNLIGKFSINDREYLEDGMVIYHRKTHVNMLIKWFESWYNSQSCNIHGSKLWEVYYCERGHKYYYTKGCTEEEACKIMHEHILRGKKIISQCHHLTKLENEEGSFLTCIYGISMMFVYKLPQNITAVYLCFSYKKEGFFCKKEKIELEVSFSSKYLYKKNEWHWKREFIPSKTDGHFITNIYSDKNSFLKRVIKYMNQIFKELAIENNPFFKGKEIFIGFKGEIPINITQQVGQ